MRADPSLNQAATAGRRIGPGWLDWLERYPARKVSWSWCQAWLSAQQAPGNGRTTDLVKLLNL